MLVPAIGCLNVLLVQAAGCLNEIITTTLIIVQIYNDKEIELVAKWTTWKLFAAGYGSIYCILNIDCMLASI